MGSILGLIITIPLYYFFGIDGIVPGMIAASIVTLLLSWFFSNRIKIQPIKVNRIRTIAEGKNMLYLGFMISLSGIMVSGFSYIVRVFISHSGGLEQVGLYNAGFTLINTYVGLVFTAMATDYFPRLSNAANNNQACKQIINQQAEIAILILSPILLVFLIFINWVILILYSSKFIAINEMVYWAALGMFFKAASWSIAFIFLAKGNKKLFFWNELISNVYILFLNLLGYYFMGLVGLGISFMLGYFLYLIQVFFVCKIKFEFAFDKEFTSIFTFQFCLAVLGFLAVRYSSFPFIYIIGIILILISTWYSYKELDKRLAFKSIILNMKNRNNS
jgi:O-antigen/teichoic acid export membrane protein